jgi:hypothetical protein
MDVSLPFAALKYNVSAQSFAFIAAGAQGRARD